MDTILPDTLSTLSVSPFSQPDNPIIAVGTFDFHQNSIKIISNSSHPSGSPTPNGNTTQAKHPLPFPATALEFAPTPLTSSLQATHLPEHSRQILASTSDSLRLFEVNGPEVIQRANFVNVKDNRTAPLTGLDWSKLEPTKIVTCSIDTTCSVWDTASQSVITQLIAHDRAVYSVKWAPDNTNNFASVGADGSLRLFDLRSLDHSTILFDSNNAPNSGSTAAPPPTPVPNGGRPSGSLLRLAFSPTNPLYIGIIQSHSSSLGIVDVRMPGVMVMHLNGHRGAVNGLCWKPPMPSSGNTVERTPGMGRLMTCSEDYTALLWDISQHNTPPLKSAPPVVNPDSYYIGGGEIIDIVWETESVALLERVQTGGTRIRTVKF